MFVEYWIELLVPLAEYVGRHLFLKNKYEYL